MSNFFKYVSVALAAFMVASGFAYAASNVERIKKNFVNGFSSQGDSLLVGGATIGSSGTEIVKVHSEVSASINFDAASAGAAVVATDAVTGAALGNDCSVVPLLDDAAWDNGTLTCYVESANVVKLVFHADDTGADPAAMTYRITLLQF
jgi:hypothetical protein